MQWWVTGNHESSEIYLIKHGQLLKLNAWYHRFQLTQFRRYGKNNLLTQIHINWSHDIRPSLLENIAKGMALQDKNIEPVSLQKAKIYVTSISAGSPTDIFPCGRPVRLPEMVCEDHHLCVRVGWMESSWLVSSLDSCLTRLGSARLV